MCIGCQCGHKGLNTNPSFFRCHSCSYPITEHEFSLSGTKPYHKLCFKELTHPKCEVCHQFIPTNDAGLIEYRCHPFWNQKYCPSHEYDKTARCCSCERLEYILKLGDIALAICISGFTSHDVPPPRGPFYWTLGDVFMGKCHTVFDYRNKRVGFAEAK
ncbi:hypothetical protein AALP_AA6G328400 [Arabis alpina]|uniref:Peptidase A1 domain-containing protein n=1 Tax=Arabis alpina TaxID=50452 RepID=A0A087GT80_ARAAL|nr:hypothetical protein AALP_AA6G328400 [Arabis alpina]